MPYHPSLESHGALDLHKLVCIREHSVSTNEAKKEIEALGMVVSEYFTLDPVLHIEVCLSYMGKRYYGADLACAYQAYLDLDANNENHPYWITVPPDFPLEFRSSLAGTYMCQKCVQIHHNYQWH